MDHFPLMARFNAWANRRLYQAVASLPEAAYRAERGAFFGSVHRTLNHLLVVDRLWSGRIRGEDHGSLRLDQILCDDLATLRAAREVEDERLIELVDGFVPADLAQIVRYRRVIGEGEEEVRTDHILLTLFNHQTHHRGQVHILLTQEGIVPPPLDVVFFLEDLGLSRTPDRP